MKLSLKQTAIVVVILTSFAVLAYTFTGPELEKSELYISKEPVEKTSNSDSILDVPFVFQKPWYCSEASASMVLKYYGYDFSQEQINELGYDRFENMLPFISKYVKSSYASLTIDDLKKEIDSGNPVIIRILAGYLHTVVVVGYGEDYLYIHDPAVGAYLKAKFENLLTRWEPTGFTAIVFHPQ